MQTDDARVFAVQGSNGGFQAIETFCRSSSIHSSIPVSSDAMGELSEMTMAIDAATRIRFRGVHYVHGWLAQSFSNSPSPPSLRMVATARQFCSYIVVLGSISSATTFAPKFAVLLQNKEELTIPLLLETIPNATQFRDSIESLSPEQQHFAKAYRAMQLESTLFSIVLLQVKPQLEKVLQLMPGSLTTEISLTQDIMKLFVECHIPAELLSYYEMNSTMAMSASAQSRITSVKENVKKIMDIVDGLKGEEVKEKSRQREYLEERKEEKMMRERAANEALITSEQKGDNKASITLPSTSRPPAHNMANNYNVFYLGVARVTENKSVVMASYSNNTDVDRAGVKLVLEQPNFSITPGKHYSFTAAQISWHFISGFKKSS